MLRPPGRGLQPGCAGGSPKAGQTASILPDLQKLSTHSIVVSLNRIFRLNNGRKSATKESLQSPQTCPRPEPTPLPNKTNKTEEPIDSHPTPHNPTRTPHPLSKTHNRPTLKHKRVPFAPNPQELSPNRPQNTKMTHHPKRTSADFPTSHGLSPPDQHPARRQPLFLPTGDPHRDSHSLDSDPSLLQSKSRKTSIQAKLAPISLMHSYQDQPHELVDLISKFKFQNLKTSHLPSDSSKQSLKGKAAELSLNRRSRKPDTAFFEEEEEGERRRGNKTASRMFNRENSKDKFTFYEQVDSAMARGRKQSRMGNNNYLSPWATLKVDNFSLLE